VPLQIASLRLLGIAVIFPVLQVRFGKGTLKPFSFVSTGWNSFNCLCRGSIRHHASFVEQEQGIVLCRTRQL